MFTQTVNGILLLDKPLHMSSNQALQAVRRLFQIKKAGHTGNLDPLATGELPLCLGKATKFAELLLSANKVYEVEMHLGMKTTTGDAEGEVSARYPITSCETPQLLQVFSQFLGEQLQIPPMYSAIKHHGVPLYKLARRNETVERKPRTIYLHQLELISNQLDRVRFRVHCSKGTYVRTLVEDMAERLHTGAYVSALRRVAVTPFEQQKMYTLAELEALVNEHGIEIVHAIMLPVDQVLGQYPSLKLSSAASYYLKQGQAVRATAPFSQQTLVRLYDELNDFLGLGEVAVDGRVQPKRLMV